MIIQCSESWSDPYFLFSPTHSLTDVKLRNDLDKKIEEALQISGVREARRLSRLVPMISFLFSTNRQVPESRL
jgi:hypothetical protein